MWNHARLCLGQRHCTSRRQVQDRCQSTPLSASDLNNTRATIISPFHNMECKITNKIGQHKTWTDADIPCINITPNHYNALTQAIFYVRQWLHNPIQLHDVTVTTLRRHVNGTEIVLKSTDRWLNITFSSCTGAKPLMFDSVYIKGNQVLYLQHGHIWINVDFNTSGRCRDWKVTTSNVYTCDWLEA